MNLALTILCSLGLILLLGCEEEAGGPAAPPENRAPELDLPNDVTGVVSQPTVFFASANDPDGDPVTFSVSAILSISELRAGVEPGPLGIDASTGMITYTPAAVDVPERGLRVTADDGHGHVVTEDVMVAVSDL